MKIVPLPAKERVDVMIDREDDVIVSTLLDFDMGIFSYSDGNGNRLFVAKCTDVDFYIVDDVYRKKIARENITIRLIEAGIQGW